MIDSDISSILGLCLQGNSSAIKELDRLDMDTVIEQVDLHGIAPLLFYCLKNSENESLISEKLLNYISQAHQLSVALAIYTDQELEMVYPLFNNSGIDFLIFKGTPLSVSLYPQPHLRIHIDTDFIFPDKNTAQMANSLLLRNSYEAFNAVQGQFISQELCCYKRTKSGFIHYLDLHWNVNNMQHFSGMFSFQDLRKNSTTLSIKGNPRTPNPVYSLVLACIHRVAHIPVGEANRLIWLYDIHLLSNKFSEAEWKELVDISLQKKLAAIILDGLEKSQLFLNTSLPNHVISILQNHKKESVLIPCYDRRSWYYLLSNLKSLPTWNSRLMLIRENLFPAAEYMYNKYSIRQPLLLPFLYLLRILNGIPKIFR